MPATTEALDTATATRLRSVLGRLSRQLRTTAASTDAGLTPTKISVLLSVDRRGTTRISEVAEIEALNPTLLSRTISTLVDAGLLDRVLDAGDRRTAWVEVTHEGHRLAERMRRERTEVVNRGMSALPESERRILEQAIPALEALADRFRDESR
ncbi:MAG: MarR family transcriptional regulator [Solirubrobacteraceae bacterium]